ncbi:hypothetical protein JNL27_09630 [bacterium]|nr:hypothetical protein [bacterium]
MLFGEKPKKSIKGSLLIARLQFIQHLKLNWMEMLKQLPSTELQKMIKGNYSMEEYFATPDHMLRMISSATWYDCSIYNSLIKAMIVQAKKEKNLTTEQVCIDSGKFTAQSHLKGLMAYVLGWGSVERTISLISKGWGTYYSEGEIVNIKNTPGDAQVNVIINYLIPELQYITVGYFQQVLETKAIKDFVVRSNYSVDAGGTFQYFITWKP